MTTNHNGAEMTEDNLLEYDDPQIYDLENTGFEPGGSFILELARKVGNPVLELGCGTGRLTIPLAQAGVDITGIDIVPGMLERGKQKAGDLPIEWVQADARDYHLGRTFRLIFESGSVFQHMLTRPDQEAFLARVREHLDDDGLFTFGSIFPALDRLEDVQEEKNWYTTKDPDGREIRVSGTEYYDPLRQVKVETAYRRWTDVNGKEVVKVVPLSLRYNFPQELDALLHYNGFKVLERYGDADLSPLTNESGSIICVCQKRV
jgi:SAM-dependent methyltransferase